MPEATNSAASETGPNGQGEVSPTSRRTARRNKLTILLLVARMQPCLVPLVVALFLVVAVAHVALPLAQRSGQRARQVASSSSIISTSTRA